MAKKGERKITEEEIINLVSENGIVSANQIAALTEVNYITARNRLEELVKNDVLILSKHTPGKNTTRRYKIGVESKTELSLRENAPTTTNI